MKIKFLDKLACPFDKHDLEIKIYKEEQDEILEGILTCEHCHRYYPILHGIPIMSPDEYRQVNLEIPILDKWGEKLLLKNDGQTFQLTDKKQTTISEE
jgi:uncharacterized protein